MKLSLNKDWFERNIKRDEAFEVGVGWAANQGRNSVPSESEPNEKDGERRIDDTPTD